MAQQLVHTVVGDINNLPICQVYANKDEAKEGFVALVVAYYEQNEFTLENEGDGHASWEELAEEAILYNYWFHASGTDNLRIEFHIPVRCK